jgi:hypothetical protein
MNHVATSIAHKLTVLITYVPDAPSDVVELGVDPPPIHRSALRRQPVVADVVLYVLAAPGEGRLGVSRLQSQQYYRH